MSGFDHGSHATAERDDPATAARNSRNGLWLFGAYFAVYAAFVGLNAFSPDVMATNLGGVNLAIVYGMVLIVAALVLALVYCWLCRSRSEQATSWHPLTGKRSSDDEERGR